MSETTDLTPVLQKSLDLTKLNQAVAALVAKGESIEVSDASTCLDAKQFELNCKEYEKAVDLYTDADITAKQAELNQLRIAKKRLLDPMQNVKALVQGRRKHWEELERRNAEAEQRRLQEEENKKAAERAAAERTAQEKHIAQQLKKGEIGKRDAENLRGIAKADEIFARQAVPQVKVAPTIPTVQGVQSRRRWTFKVVDPYKIPRAYLCPAMETIGAMVREKKNAEEAEKTCPGIKVWSE